MPDGHLPAMPQVTAVDDLFGTHTMEAYRRGDRFFVYIDLPGVDRKDIDLTVERT